MPVIPGGVPETGQLLPAGFLRLRVAIDGDAHHDDGRLAPKVTLTVEEPAEAVGQIGFQNFYLGTHEDPDAEQDATWKRHFPCRDFVTMAHKAGISTDGRDVATVAAELEGQLVGALCSIVTEPDVKNGEPNKYAGQQNNRFRWLRVDEREPFTKPAEGEPVRSTRPAPPPAAAAAPRPAPAAARPAPAAAPARAAVPAAPPARVAAAPPRTAGAGIRCTLCPPDAPLVARAEFPGHMDQAHPE